MLNPQHTFVDPLLDWHEKNGRHYLHWRESDCFAAEERVLKIRVLIEMLPDQYSVRIDEVDPPNN